jgi:hypothetical protein
VPRWSTGVPKIRPMRPNPERRRMFYGCKEAVPTMTRVLNHIFWVSSEKRIQTSHLAPDPSDFLKAWTLVGTLATMLGYIIQYIGLLGMHWPTQVAQFAFTLIMTAVRAFIRRAPPRPLLERPPQPPTLCQEIPDKHELDWLSTKFREMPCNNRYDTQERSARTNAILRYGR